MKKSVAVFIFIIFAALSGNASASATNTQVFPPKQSNEVSDCPSGQEAILSWKNGAAYTHCLDKDEVRRFAIPGKPEGQDVLSTALPGCAAGQVVTHTASGFECSNPNTPNVCPNGKVLTYTQQGFICVDTGNQTVPTCAPGQFLTYNGTNFACSGTQPPAITLSCPTGKVLTGINNNQPVCADAAAGGGGGNVCYQWSPPELYTPTCSNPDYQDCGSTWRDPRFVGPVKCPAGCSAGQVVIANGFGGEGPPISAGPADFICKNPPAATKIDQNNPLFGKPSYNWGLVYDSYWHW